MLKYILVISVLAGATFFSFLGISLNLVIALILFPALFYLDKTISTNNFLIYLFFFSYMLMSLLNFNNSFGIILKLQYILLILMLFSSKRLKSLYFKIPKKILKRSYFFVLICSVLYSFILNIRSADVMVLLVMFPIVGFYNNYNEKFGVLILLLVLAFNSGSRASVLSIIMFSLFSLINLRWVFITFSFIIILTINYFRDFLFEIYDNEPRILVWNLVLEFFNNSPIFNKIFGFGTLPNIDLYAGSGLLTEAWYFPHNDFVSILHIGGFIGLFLFVLILLLQFKNIHTARYILSIFPLFMFENINFYMANSLVFFFFILISNQNLIKCNISKL